ncbi:MAG TPA: hypothetical protein VE736_03815 [Gaiellaceae bacterium]|jgi:hypothetical protein|nr:hypothetical protein [Gaiellaceae bacterium]
MTLASSLRVAATDLYHQAWRLLILNTVLGAALVAAIVASFVARSALFLVVLVGPVAVAVMHCAVTLAQTEDLRLAELLVGLRRYWRRGLALGGLLALGVALAIVVVPFYARAGTWAWPLAALCVYVLLLLGVFQLALWPLAVFEADRPFALVARDALRVVARRPWGFASLAGALLLVNVIGVAAAILPFLTLTIAYSFLVSAHFALPKNPAREV